MGGRGGAVGDLARRRTRPASCLTRRAGLPRPGRRSPLEDGVDPLDVEIGEAALVDSEAVIVGLDQHALAAPIPVAAGTGLDRHRGADVPAEVGGGAKGPLQPGTGYLEEVSAARNGVLLVEGGANAVSGPGQ